MYLCLLKKKYKKILALRAKIHKNFLIRRGGGGYTFLKMSRIYKRGFMGGIFFLIGNLRMVLIFYLQN